MEKYGQKVEWSMEALDGTLIQSADASLAKEVKTVAGENGNKVAAVEYDDKVEFSINAVMLEDGDENDVKDAVREWAAKQAVDLFKLDSGGSTVLDSFEVHEAIEDVKTIDISCTYYPYMKDSSASPTSLNTASASEADK